MAKALAVAVSLLSLALLGLSSACGGGGGTTIDIKDFDTARFTMTQTATSDGDVGQLAGEGVVDNRQQALSVTLEGQASPTTIGIGPTIYSYNESTQSWEAFTEEPDGQVGFGRPYWPQFWRDAVQIQDLGGESRATGETTRYLLTFDRERVKKHLQSPEAEDQVEVRQAEVEVWVDVSSRYAVQLTFRLELALGAQTTKIEVTSIFSDFGAEVQIQAPEGVTPTPTPTPAGP